MKQKFLSLLLAAVLAVTSVDMTVFAVETECEEDVCAQVEKIEINDVEEKAELTDQIGQTEETNESEAVTDMELLEDIIAKEEIKTVEDAQKETFTENISDEDAVKMAIEIQEETDEKEEAKKIQDDDNGAQIKPDEKTEDQLLEIEETDGNIESSDKLIQTQTDEMETADVDVAASYERISRVSRDDGTWLFPLSKSYWNSFTDWAGCPGYSKCSFCGTVHSSWGDEAHTGQSYGHNGFDIGVPIGTSVLSAASGTVAYTSTGNNGGRGNFIVIEHPISGIDFSYYSYYQHLNSISVAKGASVKAGDTIAKSGNSGIGTGAHLHFGIVIAKKGTNIGSRLYEIENKGWVTGSGNKEGRILVNPSTKQQNMPTGSSAVIPPLAYHSGSVIYTFDASKVTVGSGSSGAASTLQITGQTPPGNGNIQTGAYWTCNGTISSNYIINEVSGYILASDNSTVLYSKTINQNASSYSLANGAIDKALLFNKLSAGTYYYKITTKDTSGKTISYNVKFTVTDPAPVPCNFSGQIISPANWADYNIPKVKVSASASDAYAINSFVIKLYFNDNNIRTETITATKAGNSYVCNYDFDLPSEGEYLVNVAAVCANGAAHSIGSRYFAYDATAPIISDLKVYEDDGDFYCSANVTDSVTGVKNAEIVIRDEGGNEKRFECSISNNLVWCIWSDISGLWTSGKYTITLYAQDNVENISYAALQNVVIAEVSSGLQKIDITVGEEKEVGISVNTLFKTEAKSPTQKTDKGMKAVIKGIKPGCSKFSFEWIAKNNVFSTNHNYDIYVYTVPQAPKITKISNKLEGCDVITYEPVQYAKTYELYRKRIGIDADYIPYEEFSDNKSHSVIVEHTDKNVVYYYRVCAKAEEATDARTNEKYYPTSILSNEVYSEGRWETEESSASIESSSAEESSASKESSGIEESSVSEESAAEEEGTSEDASLPEEGDITDGLYISGLQTKTYTGSAIKQDIQVYYNQILLKEGKDYTLSYKNNINAGKALLTIKAKGNLTGSVTKSFEIKPREITDKDVIIEDTVYIHDNKPHKKAPRVIYKGKNLKEKKDFEVSSYGKGNYTSEGTYTATIKGIGNFKGSCSTAKIIIVDKSKDISKATLEKIPVQEYQNGKAIELPDKLIKVTIAKTTLKKDIDYTVSYANNVHAGKATLIIKGKGDYAGTKKVNFTIKRTPTALTSSMITNKNKISTVTIQKNGAMPKPVLKSDNNTLMEGRDYVLSYKNNKKTGTGTAVIKGKGSYTGTFEMSFKIISKELTNSDINIRVSNVPYIGKPNKYQSIPVLTDSDGGVLVKNKDYIIESYKEGKKTLDKNSNPEEGSKITVTIKGMGNYTGTVQASYALEGISFSKAIIKVNPKLYTGKPVTIDAADITSATIKTGKKQIPLKFGKDFEIAAYSNNLTKGTATITFRGIGAYAGEKTIKFKITPTAISGKNG